MQLMPRQAIVAPELAEIGIDEDLQDTTSLLPLASLSHDSLTHTVLHIHTDRSDENVERLLKQVRSALQPSAILVESRRRPGRKVETDVASVGDDSLTALTV